MFGLPLSTLVTYAAIGLACLVCIVYLLAYIAGKAVIHAKLDTLMKGFRKVKSNSKGDQI